MSTNITTRAKWLTAQELAQAIDVPITKVWQLSNLPGAPVLRIGRRSRYSLDNFRSWLEHGGPEYARRQQAAVR